MAGLIDVGFIKSPEERQLELERARQQQLQDQVPSAADALLRLQRIQQQVGGGVGLGQQLGIGPLSPAGSERMQAESLMGLLANPVTSQPSQAVFGNVLQSQLMPQPVESPELTAAQRNFQFMQSLSPEQQEVFSQFVGGPTTEINVGQSEFGTIPPGYQLKRSDSGELSMKPIPGGPAEQDLNEKQRKQQRRQLFGAVTQGVINDDINRAIGLVENANIPVTGFGAYLKNIPASSAKNLDSLLDTVKANISFDKLQQMREASPTGGALGQVSDFENRLLQSTMANLGQAQSKEQFLYNLRRVQDTYNLIIHGTARPGEVMNSNQQTNQFTLPNGVTVRKVK